MKWLLTGFSIAAMAASGCEASRESKQSSESTWLPQPLSQLPMDRTLDEWAVEWSRWTYAQTSCDSAATDLDGSQCGLYQDASSPVFFLTFGPSSEPRTECEVPKGKALFVPITTFYVDNMGEDPPLSDAMLTQYANDALEGMSDQSLTVNGAPIAVDQELTVPPTKHTAWLPPVPNRYSCNDVQVGGGLEVDPIYVAGYFAMLPAPPVGEHEITYGGSFLSFGASAREFSTMHIRVRERSDE